MVYVLVLLGDHRNIGHTPCSLHKNLGICPKPWLPQHQRHPTFTSLLINYLVFLKMHCSTIRKIICFPHRNIRENMTLILYDHVLVNLYKSNSSRIFLNPHFVNFIRQWCSFPIEIYKSHSCFYCIICILVIIFLFTSSLEKKRHFCVLIVGKQNIYEPFC